MTKTKNPFGKTVRHDQAYATYRAGDMEWRVLKTYKKPANEASDPYARWYVAAKSPMTYGSWEMGDAYAAEIKQLGNLVFCTPEWQEHYLGQVVLRASRIIPASHRPCIVRVNYNHEHGR